MKIGIENIRDSLEEMMASATEKVRPPNYMIKFYNSVSYLPLKLGTIIFLLTAIDTGRVSFRAMQNKTDAAIQVIYEYRFRPWRLFWAMGDHLWLMSYNCRSVRSRGLFTRNAISFLLGNIAKNEKKVLVASIGSGSGSQMLQGIADNNFKTNGLHLLLVDNDVRALERGRINARHLDIEDLITTKEASVGRYLKEAEKESVNLVEMVGLTDYFDDERFNRYLEGIYDIMQDDGFFLGANISSEEEAQYAHGVACWPKMYYRSEESIIKDLKKAGFGKLWTKECGLYTFWIAQK